MKIKRGCAVENIFRKRVDSGWARDTMTRGWFLNIISEEVLQCGWLTGSTPLEESLEFFNDFKDQCFDFGYFVLDGFGKS